MINDNAVGEIDDRTRRLEVALQGFKDKQRALELATWKITVAHARINALHEAAGLLAHWHKECSSMGGKTWAEAFLEAEIGLRKRGEEAQQMIARELEALRGISKI
jgi:hypothetical protein